MTTKNVGEALRALKEIGNEYGNAHKKIGIEELGVFVGDSQIELTMRWWLAGGEARTLPVARQSVAIADELPVEDEEIDIDTETTDENGTRVDVSVVVPLGEVTDG